MTPRFGAFLVACGVVASAATCASSTHAEQPIRRASFLAGAAAQKRTTYASFAQGDSITSGGQTYVVLSGVRAIAVDPGQEPAGLTVLEHKARFVIYQETRPAMQSTRAVVTPDAAMADANGQPLLTNAVVMNTRTGRSGVVLGTLIVKLADMSQADAIAAAQGLTVSARFDHLNLVFYSAAPGTDLAAVTAALRADTRVTSADPEILENPKVPN